jgi:hypothetical protein
MTTRFTQEFHCTHTISIRASPEGEEGALCGGHRGLREGDLDQKGDDLVRALGIDGISKSEVSRICKLLDEDVDGRKGS